ncbi:hypothetical protein SKAU_G00025920 [Synaphobranchus kaupii]|uniref:Secreted protein n=1 Tax=Synaphobranchus kaupii TaxID=118154 RepID=A0A9Q1GCT7_SYNKA|nr:hypothetical protein SKAU_G00025920 [Synaphobranchus kaupii]
MHLLIREILWYFFSLSEISGAPEARHYSADLKRESAMTLKGSSVRVQPWISPDPLWCPGSGTPSEEREAGGMHACGRSCSLRIVHRGGKLKRVNEKAWIEPFFVRVCCVGAVPSTSHSKGEVNEKVFVFIHGHHGMPVT